MMTFPVIASTHNPALAAELTLAINQKTKPLASLGRLESLAHQIGLIQRTCTPVLSESCIFIFAGDHGVVAEGVSAFPQEVTWQMVENFLAGGAAINVFAQQNKMALAIIDAGVNHDFGVRQGLHDLKIAHGTANFAQAAAMSQTQCQQALQNGMNLLRDFKGQLVGFGEMGIGNTTSAAALMHAVTGLDIALCVGAGTGLDATGIAHKQSVIESAVGLHGQQDDALTILACYGGFEIATMVGAMLAAAERGKILLIDGFIVTSALLIAAKIAPNIVDYCIFAHQSDESGHAKMLDFLGVKPLLKLDLRLGEGTGSALAYPLVQAAVNFLNQMATFASASVSEKEVLV